MARPFSCRPMTRLGSLTLLTTSSRIRGGGRTMAVAHAFVLLSFRRIEWPANIWRHIGHAFAKNFHRRLESSRSLWRRSRHEDRHVLSFPCFGLEPRQRAFSPRCVDGIDEARPCSGHLRTGKRLEHFKPDCDAWLRAGA